MLLLNIVSGLCLLLLPLVSYMETSGLEKKGGIMDDVIMLLLIIAGCAIIGRTAANWSVKLGVQKALEEREARKEKTM